jgi:hypothetical protein
MKNKQKDKLTSELFIKVEKCFRNICFFLFDKDPGSEQKIMDLTGLPKPCRQKVLKDMNFIEICTDI